MSSLFGGFGEGFSQFGDSENSSAISQLKGQMIGDVYVAPHMLQYIGAAMQNFKANKEAASALSSLEEAIQSGGGSEALLQYAKASKNRQFAEQVLMKMAGKKEQQAATQANMQMLAQAFPGLTQQEIAAASMADKPEDAVKMIMEMRKPITTPGGAVLQRDADGNYINAPGSIEAMQKFLQTQEDVKAGSDVEWLVSPDGTLRPVTRKQIADSLKGSPTSEPTLVALATFNIPEQFVPMVTAAAQRYGIPPQLLAAVVQKESAWNPNAKGAAGEIGLGQLMPETAKELGVTDRADPVQNLDGAAKYLRQLVDKYDGDLEKALQAYNGGMGNVDKGTVSSAAQAYAKDVKARITATGAPRAGEFTSYDPSKQNPALKAASEEEVKIVGERARKLSDAKADIVSFRRAINILEKEPGLIAGFMQAENINKGVQTLNKVFGTDINPEGVRNSQELRAIAMKLTLDKVRLLAPVTELDFQKLDQVTGSIEQNPMVLLETLKTAVDAYDRSLSEHNALVSEQFPKNKTFFVKPPQVRADGSLERREAQQDKNSLYKQYPNVFDRRVSGTARETPQQRAARLRQQYKLGD